MEEKNTQKGLSQGQKTGFVLLFVFALITVSLGFLQMRNTIYGPFVLHFAGNDNITNIELDENTRLQQIDTDRDGLNDYEELFFYETSPYLFDTDSDGLGDKDELDQGKDPLCAEGKACGSDITQEAQEEFSPASPLLADVATPAEILIGSQVEQTDSGLTTVGGVDLSDPQQIRYMLLSTGQISEEQLAEIDDETLLQFVQEILQNETFVLPTSTQQ